MLSLTHEYALAQPPCHQNLSRSWWGEWWLFARTHTFVVQRRLEERAQGCGHPYLLPAQACVVPCAGPPMLRDLKSPPVLTRGLDAKRTDSADCGSVHVTSGSCHLTRTLAEGWCIAAPKAGATLDGSASQSASGIRIPHSSFSPRVVAITGNHRLLLASMWQPGGTSLLDTTSIRVWCSRLSLSNVNVPTTPPYCHMASRTPCTSV